MLRRVELSQRDRDSSARGEFKRLSQLEDDEVRLSPREQEILELLVKGYRYKEVADHFSCSINNNIAFTSIVLWQ